jgi:hypothetical protein
MSGFETTYVKENGWHVQHILHKEQPIWQCDLFGDGEIILEMDKDISGWRRFWTKFFFGSSWRNVDEKRNI